MATRNFSVRLAVKENKKFEADLTKVGQTGKSAIDRITKATKPASLGLKSINVASKTARTSLAGLKSIIPGLGVAFAATGIVKTVADFEEAISGLQAVSRATDDQIGELTETARGLGATTKFSATEAAEGMEFLARAGFDTNQILAAIPATLNLASAGNISLAQSADIASNVLSGFQLQASETSRVVDVLALATSKSNTDIIQLGDALKFAAPIASQFNVSIESATSAIGVLSNAGLQATLAGTGLRRVIKELATPSDQLVEFLGTASLQTRSLAELMDILANSAITGGDAFDIFGDRGAPAFLVMKSGVETFGDLNEAMLNASGTAQEMADIRLDNLRGSATKTFSAIKELTISLDEQNGLSGALKSFIDRFGTGVQLFNTERILRDAKTFDGALFRLNESIAETKDLLREREGASDSPTFFSATKNEIQEIEDRLKQFQLAKKALLLTGENAFNATETKTPETNNKALEEASQQAEVLKSILKIQKDLNNANSPDDGGVAKTIAEFEQSRAKINELIKSANDEGKERALAALKVAEEIQFNSLEKINAKALEGEAKIEEAKVKAAAKVAKSEEKRKAANEKVLTNLVDQTAALNNTKELNFVNLQLSKLGADATEEQVRQTELLAREFLKVKAAKEEALEVERQAALLNLKPQFGFGTGAKSAKELDQFKDLENQAKESLKVVRTFGETIAGRLEDSITESLTNLEFSMEGFRGFAFSLLKDIQSEIIRSSIAKPLANQASGAIQQGLGFLASSFFHDGGTVGETQVPTRLIPASTFKNAPRLHDGLLPDEFPAILQRGEEVIPKDGKNRGQGGNVRFTIQVNINGNSESTVNTEGQGNELGERITGVVLDVIAQEQAPGGLLNQTGDRAA